MISINTFLIIITSVIVYASLKRIQYLYFNSIHNLPSASGTDHVTQIARNEPGKQGWEWCKEKNSLVITYNNSLFGKDIYVADVKAINFLLNSYRTVPATWSLRRRINLLGHGLVTAQLDDHSRQRRILSHAFTTSHLKTLVPIFNEFAARLVSRLQKDLDESDTSVLNFAKYSTFVTTDIIGKTGFNYDFHNLDSSTQSVSKIAQAFRHAALKGKPPVKGLLSVVLSPAIVNVSPFLTDWTIFETNRASKAARSITEEIGREIVARKVEEIKSELSKEGKEVFSIKKHDPALAGKDLLHVLVKSSLSTDLPSNQRLSPEELIGQITTFLFAGSDTTSMLLSFTLHYLSINPLVQSTLITEIDNFHSDLAQGGEEKEITWENVNNLVYLRAVVLETLRLCPALPTLARVTREKLVVPLSSPLPGSSEFSFVIEKGAQVAISLYAANRDPNIWEKAEEFYPERWLEGGLSNAYSKSDIPKSQGHMSFSTGEKNCIGWKMAETEAKVLLSTFLKSFRVEPVSEITSILELVARPAVLGEESKGSQLPLRLIRRE